MKSANTYNAGHSKELVFGSFRGNTRCLCDLSVNVTFKDRNDAIISILPLEKSNNSAFFFYSVRNVCHACLLECQPSENMIMSPYSVTLAIMDLLDNINQDFHP